METLKIPSVELVSTLRKVPRRGAPTTLDFNDSEKEKLIDLAHIVGLLNDSILPILQALPVAAAEGLEGRSLFADTTDHTGLFFDQQGEKPITVADSLRYLNSLVKNIEGTVTDVRMRMDAISSKLAATGQNDISIALQNAQASMSALQSELNAIKDQINQLQASQGDVVKRLTTGQVDGNATAAVAVAWAVPFADNNYVVEVSIEDDSGFLSVVNFSYQPNGAGITVRVKNADAVAHSGYVHARARIA